MEKFNEKLYTNYKPTPETYELALELTSKLGKLNVRMKNIFKDDHMKPSRLFAFIESKYSSKIEGVYTTLFDVVNTGEETNQQKLIKPLVDALFKGERIIELEKIRQIEKIMNTDKDRTKRWEEKFGIYESKGEAREKIYEPPLDEKIVEYHLKQIIESSNQTTNVLNASYLHIFFEKLHPFVDANGRIGRLIYNRTIVRNTNFSNVLPISWAIFKNKQVYYDLLSDISTNENLDESVRSLLKILFEMYKVTKAFVIDLETYFNKYKEDIMNSSTKMTEEMASDILFSLQTKASYLRKKYKLNSRTINSVFERITAMDFNEKNLGREKLWWNIDLEMLVEKHFTG